MGGNTVSIVAKFKQMIEVSRDDLGIATLIGRDSLYQFMLEGDFFRRRWNQQSLCDQSVDFVPAILLVQKVENLV